jgi:hypothetical protein
MTHNIWRFTNDQLTTIGSTAAVVAIGGVALATTAPIAATILALGGAAVATGSLYAKIAGSSAEKPSDRRDDKQT